MFPDYHVDSAARCLFNPRNEDMDEELGKWRQNAGENREIYKSAVAEVNMGNSSLNKLVGQASI